MAKAKKTQSGKVEIGEYNGHPTITLPLNGDRFFCFGLKKAQAIVAYLSDIKKFVAANK